MMKIDQAPVPLIVPDTDDPRLTESVTGTDQSGARIEIKVPVERPLTLYLNSQEIVTMMTIGDHPEYLALGYLLIPRLGIAGAALALSAAILVNNVAPLLEVRTFIAIDPFGRAFAVGAGAALGCFGMIGLVARLAAGQSAAALLAASLSASASYVVVLWAFRNVLSLTVLWQTIEHKRSRGPRGSLEQERLA